VTSRVELRSAFQAISSGKARQNPGTPRTIDLRLAALPLGGKLRKGSQSVRNPCL